MPTEHDEAPAGRADGRPHTAAPDAIWLPHPAQQALLAAEPAAGISANCTFAYRVDATVEADRLAAAYRKVLGTFDALRLAVEEHPTGPRWRTGPRVYATVTVHPATSEPPEQAAVLAARRACSLLPPRRGLLGAVHLDRFTDGTWLISEVFHHVIADGRSLTLLHESVEVCYNTGGRPAPAKSSGRYGDLLVAAGGRDSSTGDPNSSTSDDRWWWHHFDGFEPVRLPGDPAAGARRTVVRFDRERTDQLVRAAGSVRATLAATVLAAHLHAVARYTGVGDVAAHFAVDTRPPDRSDVFGQATMLVPVRARHAWEASVADHTRWLTRNLLEARQHLPVTLDDLDRAGALLPLSDPASTAFVFQDAPVHPPRLPGAAMVPVPDLHQAGGVVTVARRGPDGLSVDIRTPAGSALARHIDGFAATVAVFLAEFVADPHCRLGDDRLLPASDASAARRHAVPSTVPQVPAPSQVLTATTAATTPDRVVLVEQGRRYRADQLQDEIRQRRRRLVAAGVRAGYAIVVDDATTFGRIASFFAVLNVGAVYVPVTTALPAAQRADVTARTRAAAELVDGVVRTLPGLARHRVAASENHAVDTCAVSTRAVGSNAGAGSTGEDGTGEDGTGEDGAAGTDPAYVIFTSGSTGRPKGVVVSRAALTNLVQGEGRRFDIRPGNRVLLCAPPTTDPWICHVAGALHAGATLVCVDLRTGAPLPEYLAEHRVSHAFLPAAVFAEVSEAAAALPDLRMVATAGDRCRADAVARFLTGPPRRVFNIYGPTEATVTATVAELSAGGVPAHGPAPIGTPIDGLAARVVIDRAATAPVGVTGELMLSGVGLALGYLDDPVETARRFLPDPFRPGERWYATSDRAWLGADGQLYVDGRLDRQVKIRGFRVEPGHLEEAARATGLCHDAHTVARTTAAGDTQLCLYVDGCSAPDQLRAALQDLLPAHLLPAQIQALAHLPRTAGGKIDEQVLVHSAADDAGEDAEEHDTEAAAAWRTGDEPAGPMPLPEPFTSAWRAVLGVRPRPDDDFFAAGGDSLVALRLVRLLRTAGIDVSPADVYRHRTAAALAETGRRGQRTIDSADQRPVDAAALAPAQQWFFQLDLAEPNHWNQHHWLPFDRLPADDALRNAVHQLVAATPILSARITADGIRYPHQPWQPPVEVHTGPLADDAVAAILTRLHASTDPGAGRPLHAAAIREPGGSGVLLLVAHHLVVDDWSWRIIDDRLRAALTNPATPAAVDVGYARYTEAVSRQAGAGAFHLDQDRWRQVLHHGHSAVAGYRPAATSTLNADLTADLPGLCRRWKVSPAATLLTCLGHGLHRLQPGQTSVVDLERNGRAAVAGLDLSSTVGWVALHHPVPVPHVPADAPTAAAVDGYLRAVPDSGLSYLAGRAGPHAAPIPRFAVNITDEAPAHTDDPLAQVRRCQAPATGPANRLPYEASVVFRVTGGTVRVHLTFDPGRLSAADAHTLLAAMSAAPLPDTALPDAAVPASGAPEPTTGSGPLVSRLRGGSGLVFTHDPVSAMQHLTLHQAGVGPGVYLPRQLVAVDDIRDPAAFLADVADLFGRLEPFRQRVESDAAGQMVQYLASSTSVAVHHDAVHPATWLDAPDTIDPTAARNGGPLATITAFPGSGGTLYLGLQFHHAVIDGQGSQLLTGLLTSIARQHRTGRGGPLPDLPPSSRVAFAKHVSAEHHAAGRPARPDTAESAHRFSTVAVEQAELSADEMTALAVWADRQRTDVRAVFAAAALQLARRSGPVPVYLVGNGRTADIPETLIGLGLYWYFVPVPASAGSLPELARRVFGAAAAPLPTVRADASRNWTRWTDPVGLSVNYLKAPPGGNGDVRSIGRRDVFHFVDQLEVVHRTGGTARLTWNTLQNAAGAGRCRLAEYLTALRTTIGGPS